MSDCGWWAPARQAPLPFFAGMRVWMGEVCIFNEIINLEEERGRIGVGVRENAIFSCMWRLGRGYTDNRVV